MNRKTNLDLALEKYKDIFSEKYPLGWSEADLSSETIIENIEKCIKAGKRKKPEDYKKGIVY